MSCELTRKEAEDLFRLHDLALAVTGWLLPCLDAATGQQRRDFSALRHSLNHAMHETLVILDGQGYSMPTRLKGAGPA